jgi:hypothetical protein
MLTALREDPVGLGREVGKAVLDWDTWADDPARALGHLVPDVAAAVLTGGAGASVRALRGLDGLHDVSLLERPLHGLRTLTGDGVDLHDLTGLGRLDDGELLARINALSPEDQARLLRRGADWDEQSMADVYGPHRFSTDYSRLGGTWASGPRVDAGTIPVDGPLVNLHGRGDPGSGMFWTDQPEMLRLRSEDAALDRLALLDSWYIKQGDDGVDRFWPRDEITVRQFSGGEDMAMQIGKIGPQHEFSLTERPDGTPIPPDRPGGADQYVAGLDQPAYDTPVTSWTGPPPWVATRPDGVWGAFGAGAGVGTAGSLAAGAAAAEPTGGQP